MSTRRTFIATGLAAAGSALAGCASMGDGWITLVDGPRINSLDGFSAIGTGNWTFTDGTLQGKGGNLGYLLTRESYTDFELKAEFWADADCNSGLFLRCQDRTKVTAENSYEVNIFDKRPDPSYGTAAIVGVAKAPQPYPQAANRWNTFHVSARADRLVVVFNGQQTVDVRDGKHKSGPLALQSAGGTIRFRSVQIKPV